MLFVLDSAGDPNRRGLLSTAHFRTSPGLDSARFGIVSAVDVRTGLIRWQKKVPGHLLYGGALVTAGGLMFFGENSGWLNALDAETGETVWRFRAAEGNMGPPISFLVDGHQRIAITSRQGLTVLGLPPGSPRP
jgi:outer membrane protein assembly factor BamB